MALSEARKKYHMPGITQGSIVKVSREPNMKSPLLGIVVNCKRSAVDVIAFSPESLRLEVAFFDCFHVSDPVLTEKPKVLQTRDQSGVWDFADATRKEADSRTQIRELARQIAEIRNELVTVHA